MSKSGDVGESGDARKLDCGCGGLSSSNSATGVNLGKSLVIKGVDRSLILVTIACKSWVRLSVTRRILVRRSERGEDVGLSAAGAAAGGEDESMLANVRVGLA